MRISALALFAVVAIAPACAVTAQTEATDAVVEADSISSTSTYYSIRPDFRKCMSPMCGGFWVTKVNSGSTRCADGSWAPSCYVAQLNLKALGLDDAEASKFTADAQAGRALLRGAITPTTFNTSTLGVFAVSEGWRAPTDVAATGTFYRLTSSGIVCIAAPCPSIHEAKLNSTNSRNVTDVNLVASGANEKQIGAALTELQQTGILVAGKNVGYSIKSRPGTRVVASQYYTRVSHTCTGPAPYVPTASQISRQFSNTQKDTTVSPSIYPRNYVFDAAAGTVRIDDLVAPCPPGAYCIWSGIVSRTATFSIAADKLELAYGDTTNSFDLAYYKELSVEKDCDGSIVVLEARNDGSGIIREYR